MGDVVVVSAAVVVSEDVGAIEEMQTFLREDDLRDCPVLVLANKQDLPNAMTAAEMNQRIVSTMPSIVKRRYYVAPVTATTGEGLNEAFEWITNSILKKNITYNTDTIMNPITETIQDLKAVSITSEKSSYVSLIKNMFLFNVRAT